MPSERRNLRSNKETSSTNNDRPATTKGKGVNPKKGSTGGPHKDSGKDKPKINGVDSNKNGINGSEDVDMNEVVEHVKVGSKDEEMTGM